MTLPINDHFPEPSIRILPPLYIEPNLCDDIVIEEIFPPEPTIKPLNINKERDM